jgi:hypothetical protein
VREACSSENGCLAPAAPKQRVFMGNAPAAGRAVAEAVEEEGARLRNVEPATAHSSESGCAGSQRAVRSPSGEDSTIAVWQ